MWVRKKNYADLMVRAYPPKVFIDTDDLDFLTGAADTCIKCPKCKSISLEDANFCGGCGSQFVKGWVKMDVVNTIDDILNLLGKGR